VLALPGRGGRSALEGACGAPSSAGDTRVRCSQKLRISRGMGGPALLEMSKRRANRQGHPGALPPFARGAPSRSRPLRRPRSRGTGDPLHRCHGFPFQTVSTDGRAFSVGWSNVTGTSWIVVRRACSQNVASARPAASARDFFFGADRSASCARPRSPRRGRRT
jgi:hypothetical protein